MREIEFPEDFYTFLNENTLVEVVGGTERERFLKIWMVVVDNRVFARSWNKSNRSWFTEFIRTGRGRIKYENNILEVKGRKLENNDRLNERIDQAYLRKYNQPENIFYAKGISQPEYADSTMEFVRIQI